MPELPALNQSSTLADMEPHFHAAGEELPSEWDAETALAYLSELHGVDYSTLKSPEESMKQATGKRRGRRAAGPPKEKKTRHTIIIPSSEGPMGQGDIFVGFNGKGYQLKRDVPVEVPEGVLNVLNDAKTTVGRQTEDGDIVWQQVHSYPFSIVS